MESIIYSNTSKIDFWTFWTTKTHHFCTQMGDLQCHNAFWSSWQIKGKLYPHFLQTLGDPSKCEGNPPECRSSSSSSNNCNADQLEGYLHVRFAIMPSGEASVSIWNVMTSVCVKFNDNLLSPVIKSLSWLNWTCGREISLVVPQNRLLWGEVI